MPEPPVEPKDLAAVAVEYGPMVSSICRNMIQNPHGAEDAAQECWVEIVKSIGRFRGESKVSTWIYTVTRRVVLRWARKEKQVTTRRLSRFFRADEPSPGFPPEGEATREDVKKQCARCLVGILHCLDNDSRLAYIMRDMVSLSYAEIGRILERPEATVRKIVSRSRNKLRRFLREECFLFHPEGNCRCRMKKHVEDIHLEREFDGLRRTVRKMRFFKEAEKILPGKNYWEARLAKDRTPGA